MLQFFSASTRMANSRRAIQECLDVAFGSGSHACDLVIINASIGHPLGELVAEVREHCAGARVVAVSCAGVVGREGVSESLKDVALMAVRGREFAVAHVDGVNGANAADKAREVASSLRAQQPGINMVYLMPPGIDIANDRVIEGCEDVFGPEVTLFGATASDNMHGVMTQQAVDGDVYEHALFAVGFADPGLEVVTMASHGFVATGDPMVVTRSAGNRIMELDGKPAWPEYLRRLGLPEDATHADSIPIGACAETLPAALAEEYGNAHILRVITSHTPEGYLDYATTCPEGTQIWLTERDEELIFRDLDRLISAIESRAAGRKPVAVFQADCLARGRRLFNRIIKEELVHRMQHPFLVDGTPPPWLGMYGFGEFARLGGANTYHNYTTALAVIYRKVD